MLVLKPRNQFSRHCWDHLNLGAHRTVRVLSLCSLGNVGSFLKKCYSLCSISIIVSAVFLRIITTYCFRNDSPDYNLRQTFPVLWHKSFLSVCFFLSTIHHTDQAISMLTGLYKWYPSSNDFQILILSAYFPRKTGVNFLLTVSHMLQNLPSCSVFIHDSCKVQLLISRTWEQMYLNT